MRVLFINPNTDKRMTRQGIRVAQKVAQSGTTFVASTGRFGAAYIASRAAAAIAGHAVLDAFARDGADVDVALIACFGDPGLFALRELASVPVVGMAEASCQIAAEGGRRFAIVTGGDRWKPMLEEFVVSIGLGKQLAGVRTISLTGDRIAADPTAAMSALETECRNAAKDSAAEAVVLGGLGLAGLAEKMRDVPVPVIDSVQAAVRCVERVDIARWKKPKEGSFAGTPPVAVSKLSAALTQHFGGLSNGQDAAEP